MHHLNITQAGTLIDGKPHYSHPNYALDLAGSDSGIDFWRNMESETCFFCSGAFGTRKTGNTRFFVSCDASGKQKKILCADGRERVVTIAMTHSCKDFSIGKIYRYDEVMYQEGTAGKATGNHIHLEISEGSQRTKYYDTKLKVYRMKNEFNPVDAFFILDGYTTVVNDKGLHFKHCSSTKVEEPNEEKKPMSNADKLVDYAKTQIGCDGKKYMDWMGYEDPWCSEFVSYCANKCGFIANYLMPKAGNCRQAQEFYLKKNKLFRKKDYTPKKGDIAFFGNEGLSHTAIIEKVDGNNLTVIEGNAGSKDFRTSKVLRTTYKIDESWLWGYGTPLTTAEPKKVDLTADMKKNYRSWIVGGLAGENGTLFTVPRNSTLRLSVFHNSSPTANSEWHVTMGSKKAFKISPINSVVDVHVVDETHVLVKSTSGNPRTYWMYLE